MLSNKENKHEVAKDSTLNSEEAQNLSQSTCRTFSQIFSIQRNSKKGCDNIPEEKSSALCVGVSSPSTSCSINYPKTDNAEQFVEPESLIEHDLKPIPELGEFIIANHKKIQDNDAPSGDEMNRILTAIKLAAKVVNREINKAGLADILGAVGSENIQGEAQQKLDLFANNKFLQALANREVVCGVCSEENENFICVNKNARYVVVIDPLDGSSNLDVNVSVGTIFSIYRRVSAVGFDPEIYDFLQPGTKQIAAGYVLYGSSTILVITIGDGVHGFTLDPSLGTFYLSHPYLTFPEKGKIYSVNTGNFNAFPEGVKKYLHYCQSDEEGCPYSMRYIGSLVSDFHRNLLLGGIFLYPPTKKNKEGKLRLLYEANPMAFLAEQAGGKASDGKQRILDIIPHELHQRCPFFVGVTSMVRQLEEFLQSYNTD